MSEEKKQKPLTPEVPSVVSTFGGAWEAPFFELMVQSRPEIITIPMGHPQFFFPPDAHTKLTRLEGKPKEQEYSRLNSNSPKAVEILFRLEWFISRSNLLLVDSSLLNTAVGHQSLIIAHHYNIPAHGISSDNSLSSLAPAFLRSLAFPGTLKEILDLLRDMKKAE